MPLKIRKLPAALEDLLQLALYLGEQSPELAERFLNAADATFKLLATNPELGTCHDTSRHELIGLRAWGMGDFPRHIVFFREVDGVLEIVRVLHGARDLDNLFADD